MLSILDRPKLSSLFSSRCLFAQSLFCPSQENFGQKQNKISVLLLNCFKSVCSLLQIRLGPVLLLVKQTLSGTGSHLRRFINKEAIEKLKVVNLNQSYWSCTINMTIVSLLVISNATSLATV